MEYHGIRSLLFRAFPCCALLFLVATAAHATAADTDFQARCNAPGVLVCQGWDAASDFTPATLAGGYASGLYAADDGTFQGTMDTTNMTSGAGSLKFTIRAGSQVPFGSLPAGQWGQQFGPDGNGHVFGQGSTFYLQFRLRLSPEMMNFDWSSISGEGWKVFIVYGPIPGPSCTGTQFVQENTNQRNILTGYTSCSAPALVTNNGNTPYLFEQGDYNCPYGTNYATDPNCFQYPANTWITEYWKVALGTFGQPSTHFEAWAGVQGKPLKKWIDLPNFNFGDPADSNSGLMRIFLTPYFSGATASTTNPAAAMWFDELIVSTQPIATPADNSGTPPPPSLCDVNGDGVTNVADVQLEVNMALGISSCTNASGTCNVVSVQRVVNAALGGICVAP